MALDFPNSPSVGQEFTVGGRSWKWNGSRWIVSSSPLSRSTIDDIGDVSITSVTNGDFLRYNGSASVWINDPVNLSTDTVGDYVQSLVAGTGVSLANNSGEGATPTVAIGQAVGTSSSVTFAHVTADVAGNLSGNVTGNVTGNLTGDVTGNADTATALETARTISIGGDVSGSVSFNGTSDVTITATIQPNSVALGTDTSGNYMADVSGGTGISISHIQSEGSTATVSLNATLDNLTDVDTSAATDGQFLKYVSASTAWVPANIPTINNLDDVGDVTAPTPSSGDFLKWNGSAWVNDAVDLGTDTTGNYVQSLVAGNNITISNNSGEGATPTINSGMTISDTMPSSPTNGQVWYESDTGKTFVYYDSFWVEVSGGIGAQGSGGDSLSAFLLMGA